MAYKFIFLYLLIVSCVTMADSRGKGMSEYAKNKTQHSLARMEAALEVDQLDLEVKSSL